MNYLDFKRYEKKLISYSEYKDTKPWQRIDYGYKSLIMSTDLVNQLKKVSYEMWLSSGVVEHLDFDNRNLYDPLLLQSTMDSLYAKYGVSGILEGDRIINANLHRVRRLHERIIDIVSMGFTNYFLTFTFRDDVLSDCSPVTLRRYVQRFLKQHFINYVANVDYGEKKGRLHFHAVACANYLDPNLWPYGNLDYEKIILRNDSPIKMAQYINKLTNHAIKKSTKRQSLIYPKKKS